MKKGKSFESIARIIYESLNNLDTASIQENVLLIDKGGTKREIDILIRSTIFESIINIAIECKDHQKPVSRSMIDSFYAKCIAIPEINKLIFISKSGYQSGAISGAKLLGISLYELSDLKYIDVLSWLGIISTQAYEMERRITKIAIEFSTNPINFEHDEIIVQNGIILNITLIEFINSLITSKYPFEYLQIKTIQSGIRKSNVQEFNFEPKFLSILKNKIESNIVRIFGEVTDTPIPVKSDIKINEFKENDSNERTQIISLVSERGDITSFIKRNGKLQVISKINVLELSTKETKIIKH